MENREMQELHCHDCQKYVQFPIDLSLNGNHVLECPNCGHEHCRVVKDGVITAERWDSRNGRMGMVHTVSSSTVSYTDTSTYATSSSSTLTTDTIDTSGNSAQGQYFLYQSWMSAGGT